MGNKPLNTIGPDKLAVPTHTYKVILCVHPDGTKEMFGFVLPNLDKPSGTLSSYTFSVKAVEQMAGLGFFSELPPPERDQLESVTNEVPK